MAGWPARTGAVERAAITRMLLKSVQFREATHCSDVAPSPLADAPSATTR
jgi:hypothetical protein